VSALAGPALVDADVETARLFEAHAGEILGFCRRQLASAGDAEDALQTTFLYALRALRRGVVPESEAAWLTAIAKNVCNTQRRTVGRRGTLTAEVDVDTIALARAEPDEVGLAASLSEGLASLPENQRSALVMREWQGLGHDEIASRLDLTTTATSALLTRARHSLAAALTAAGRPRAALDVSLLVGALRMHLRSLLGGAATKASVGAAVATVAVGGVVVEQSLGPASPEREPASPPAAAAAVRAAQNGVAVRARPSASRSKLRRTAAPARPAAKRPVKARLSRAATGPTSHVVVPPAPLDPRASSPEAPTGETPREAPGREGVAPASAPPELPDPGLELPAPGVALPASPLPPLPPLPPTPGPTSDLQVDLPPAPPLPTLP
jgi:RNA polymerase sigma factor (sigma-70 family)